MLYTVLFYYPIHAFLILVVTDNKSPAERSSQHHCPLYYKLFEVGDFKALPSPIQMSGVCVGGRVFFCHAAWFAGS